MEEGRTRRGCIAVPWRENTGNGALAFHRAALLITARNRRSTSIHNNCGQFRSLRCMISIGQEGRAQRPAPAQSTSVLLCSGTALHKSSMRFFSSLLYSAAAWTFSSQSCSSTLGTFPLSSSQSRQVAAFSWSEEILNAAQAKNESFTRPPSISISARTSLSRLSNWIPCSSAYRAQPSATMEAIPSE